MATPSTFPVKAFEDHVDSSLKEGVVDSSLKEEVVGSGKDTEEDEGGLCIGSDRHDFKNAVAENGDNSTPGTRFAPVPSKSSEMALQQLDKLVSPREKSPTKLSPSILSRQALNKSLENVDSSKFLENMSDGGIFGSCQTALPGIRNSTSHKEDEVEENGSTKLVALPDKSAPAVNGVDTGSSSKNNVPTPSAKDAYHSTMVKSVVQVAQEKKQAFQMNAYEDYLDMDDDDYSNGTAFTPVGQGREKLDNCAAGSKSSATEAIVVERPPEVKPTSSSAFNQKPDLETSDGSAAVEENTGITFPVAKVATSSAHFVASNKNSAAEALVVKRPSSLSAVKPVSSSAFNHKPELGASSGSEVVEKNTGITFPVAQVATSSVQATLLASQSTSTATKDASKESDATSEDIYGDETMLVRQCMFRKLTINEEDIREYSGDEKKVLDEEKARKAIAIIDTGVNVNHECFHDEHLVVPEGRRLNIPYARKFKALENYTRPNISPQAPSLLDFNFPEDLNGHGTACASIAAGSLTELECLHNVSGICSPTIQGANPLAKVASYKVTGSAQAIDDSLDVKKSSLLDAINDAISHKVDVILVALSTDPELNNHSYLADPVNLGGYLAMKKNILLCTSAGNHGDDFYTLSGGLAPWVLVVGSCNSRGKFLTNIELVGGSLTIKGYHSFMDKDGQTCELIDSSKCFEGETNKVRREVVEGKIIFYDNKVKGPAMKFLKAGAAGVLRVKENNFKSYGLRRPIVYVNREDGERIASYIVNSRKYGSIARAKICKSVYEEENQVLPSYNSGKGPNPYDQYMPKPDVCAPGEEILCANKYNEQNMYAHYSVMSGTSMAAAVTVGMISYIKAIHKDWQPARIKSAIMTTAKLMSEPSIPSDVAASGSGCFDPLKAIDPGLVYDVSPEEFRRYLLNDFEKEELFSIKEDIEGETISGMDLNMPNFSLVLDRSGVEYIFNRRLTNVGPLHCSYKAEIKLHDIFFKSDDGNIRSGSFPNFIRIDVQPNMLEFDQKEQVQCFRLIVKTSRLLTGEVSMVHASLIWHEQIESHGRNQPRTVSSRIMIINPNIWKLRPARKSKPKEKQAHNPVLPQKRHAGGQGDAGKTKGKAIKLE